MNTVNHRTVCKVQKEPQHEAYKPLDDFDKTVIRFKVYKSYTVHHQLSKLKNLH